MMRVRDSGMPEQEYWESLVDVALTIDRFKFHQFHDVAEMGCGYGTFTEAVGKSITGKVFAYDIDPTMIATTKARTANLRVSVSQRDVFAEGFGVEVDAALLFNILHSEEPERLLRIAAEAAPVIFVTHWIQGSTPRGPSEEIRPTPNQIAEWASQCSLEVVQTFTLPPWHFGMILKRFHRNRSSA
jgi:SAM-dependent methyltransferase